jgi:hypothetical protein
MAISQQHLQKKAISELYLYFGPKTMDLFFLPLQKVIPEKLQLLQLQYIESAK